VLEALGFAAKERPDLELAPSVTEHHIAELVGSVADVTVKAVVAVGGVDAKDGSTVATG